MAKKQASARQAVVLNKIVNIPFDKLRPSDKNVRRVKNGVTIEQLAEDIGQRGLLQSLSVRALLNPESAETGFYEVQAGGRRFKALERLLKQKRLSSDTPIPCIVRVEGLAEEDSLAENTHREALHPLDQFRAFQALIDNGLSEEDIAARFFVSAKTVKQRLKLAAVSPKLLKAYADGGMTLEHLEAFSVANNHARQEQVWEQLSRGHQPGPWQIRNALTHSAVEATDSRALFVGAAAYEAAGGTIGRDLFSRENDGYFEDVALLDKLVAEKLEAAANTLRAEGWQWIESAPDFAYGHTFGFTRVKGEVPKPTKQETAARKALEAELKTLTDKYDAIQAKIDESDDDSEDAPVMPPELEQRLAEVETEIGTFDERRTIYTPKDLGRAGAFVSIDECGLLKVERGFVRRKEKAPDKTDRGRRADSHGDNSFDEAVAAGNETATNDDGGENDDVKPLSERLLTELSQVRTLALRDGLAENPEAAYLAVLYALCVNVFHHYGRSSCLDIEAKITGFMQPAAGLNESTWAKAIDARHEAWGERLPGKPAQLWDALLALDTTERADLLAHCVGVTVNALHDPWRGRMSGFPHADQVARTIGLDMAAAGWTPTTENYLGRVSKARILEAVTEAKGEASAKLIEHLKKGDMAREAERMLAGTGWLPEPLRTPEGDALATRSQDSADDDDDALPEFLG